MRFKRLLLPTLLTLGMLTAGVALADNFGLGTAAGVAGLKDPGIPALIGNILKPVLGFVGTLFLLLMIYAGFTYMTAAGDSKKIDSAKQMLTGAIIGIVIIASAYAVTSFVLGAVVAQAPASASTPGATPAPAGVGASCGSVSCHEPTDCAGAGLAGVCACPDGSNGTHLTPCQNQGTCVCAAP